MSIVKEKSISRYLFYALSAIAILLLWFTFPEGIGDMLKTKALALFFVYIFYLIIWAKCANIRSLFFFFFCYSMLSNAGQLFLYAFDVEILGSPNVFEISSRALIEKSMDYQVLCTVFMCTFALVARENHAVREKEKVELLKNEKREGINEYLTLADLVYIVSAVVVFAYNILRLGSRVNSNYQEAFNSGEATAAPFIIVLVFYVSMYLVCFKHRGEDDKFKKVIWIINIAVAISSLLFGSRSVLIPIVFGMVITLGIGTKKMTRTKKTVMFFVALIFLYLLSGFLNIRHLTLSSLSVSVVAEALFGGGFIEQLVALVTEMGGSLRCLTTTIGAMDSGIVESEQTLLYTLLKSVVPQVEILNYIGVNEPERWRLATWITERYGAEAGWGYSMYAESYYNFKNLGYLFMGFFGYVYVWLECKIEKWYLEGKGIMASGWLFVLTYTIFLARAESALLTTRLRYVVYLTIVCYLLREFINVPNIRLKLIRSKNSNRSSCK